MAPFESFSKQAPVLTLQPPILSPLETELAIHTHAGKPAKSSTQVAGKDRAQQIGKTSSTKSTARYDGLRSRNQRHKQLPAQTHHKQQQRPAKQSPPLLVKLVHRYTKATASKYSWLSPLVLLLVFAFLNTLLSHSGRLHNPLAPFFTISYKVPLNQNNNAQYGKGPLDLCVVVTGMLFFTFLRAFVMHALVKPLALKYYSHHHHHRVSPAKLERFMEQAYSAVHYGVSGPLGLYIMYTSPDLWYFETTPFYAHFPHRVHPGMFKGYYLLQAAFWAQQSVVLVLQLEKPRKDFRELVFHHAVTMALIFLSYRFHFAAMGLAVFITMDVSDFFLAASKILNYMHSPFTGPFFLVFMAVWIYLRHYLNLRILYSVLTEFATVGPFDLNWETQQYKCWILQGITFALLLALQLVNAYWLFLILRIAYRYVVYSVEKDERSDDEEEEQETVTEAIENTCHPV